MPFISLFCFDDYAYLAILLTMVNGEQESH
jgi:hypothetical protein